MVVEITTTDGFTAATIWPTVNPVPEAFSCVALTVDADADAAVVGVAAVATVVGIVVEP
jgi:hypothetical protein